MAYPAKIDLKYALQLRDEGKTLPEIAKVFNCSIPSVSRTFTAYDSKPEVIQEKLASQLEDLASRILSSIDPEDIKKASLQQRVTSVGIAIDKVRLMRGQSTTNVHSLHQVVQACTPKAVKPGPQLHSDKSDQKVIEAEVVDTTKE